KDRRENRDLRRHSGAPKPSCYAENSEANAVAERPPSDPVPPLRSVTRNPDVTGPNSHSAASGIPFNDPDTAKQILVRIQQQVSPALGSAIPALLGDSPDPDAALLGFERLISERTGELVGL